MRTVVLPANSSIAVKHSAELTLARLQGSGLSAAGRDSLRRLHQEASEGPVVRVAPYQPSFCSPISGKNIYSQTLKHNPILERLLLRTNTG